MPSMTGLIAAFDITKTVTSPLTDQEIISIQEEVIANFDVSHEEVSTTGTHKLLIESLNLMLSRIFRYWYHHD